MSETTYGWVLILI